MSGWKSRHRPWKKAQELGPAPSHNRYIPRSAYGFSQLDLYDEQFERSRGPWTPSSPPGPAYGYSPEGTPRENTSLLYPDPTQGQVYGFEHKFVPRGRDLKDLTAMNEVVARVTEWLMPGVKPVEVAAWDNYTPAFEFDHRTTEPKRILIPKFGIDKRTLIHEAAHSVAVRLFCRETHGPLFLSLVLRAYAKEFSMDEVALRLEAMTEELPLVPFDPSSRAALRVAVDKKGGPLDVEEFRDFIHARWGTEGSVQNYYGKFPESAVLTAKVNDLYEKHSKKEVDDGHQQAAEKAHGSAFLAEPSVRSASNALPFEVDSGPMDDPSDPDGWFT